MNSNNKRNGPAKRQTKYKSIVKPFNGDENEAAFDESDDDIIFVVSTSSNTGAVDKLPHTTSATTSKANSNKAKIYGNFEPIIIDGDKSDDDDDVMFVSSSQPSNVVVPNIIEIDDIVDELTTKTTTKIANEYNKNAAANGVKIETNLEPIIIDVDASDDDDCDIISEVHPLPPSNTVIPNVIEIDDTLDTVDDRTSQTLAKTSNEYNEIDSTNLTAARPWIKDNCIRMVLIDPTSQFAFYKCMVEECYYATNSSELFQQHMEAHDQEIDYYTRLLDYETRENLIGFRECAYCGLKAEANAQLIEHMKNVHRRCIYQCPHCFYRCIEIDIMLLHLETYHPASNAAILLCGQEREFQQHDDDILKNADEKVVKIRCGQGQDNCTKEFACYNSLYAHLSVEHPGKYTCPYCIQTMILDEHTITEHLSCAHYRFEEFQCLICVAGFNTISAIREHMSVEHSSNYLFVGARRTTKPFDEHSTDQIQLLYAKTSQGTSPYVVEKCSNPTALNGMNPMELIPRKQLEMLERLNSKCAKLETAFFEPVPKIPGIKSAFNIVNYETYQKLAPLRVRYKCIPDELVNDGNAIASYIDDPNDIDSITQPCNASTRYAMLVHRCQKHSEQPYIFLEIEERAQIHVYKIVYCIWHCQYCDARCNTRSQIIHHFVKHHPNRWLAAKIQINSKVIKSNDPKRPTHATGEAFEYFHCSAFVCIQFGCKSEEEYTPMQAIEHHNQHHRDTIGNINLFEFALAEKIAKNASNARETNEPHEMYLFECHRCHKLFESLAKIQQHFTVAERCVNDDEFEPRFSMKKLLRCHEDSVVRTYDGMKLHYADKHLGQQCTPVNILLPKQFCGLCNYNYEKNNDLDAHYGEKHACGGDLYGDKLLETMKLDGINIDQCKYAMGCCKSEEKSKLVDIVDHLMKCERRFSCQQCPNRKFSSAITFTLHCTKHYVNTNAAKIVENLQNTKIFLSLAQNMTIVMPNGLVVTMAEIGNTTFGQNVSDRIKQLAQDAWKREKDDIVLFLQLLKNVRTLKLQITPPSLNRQEPVDCGIQYIPLPNTDAVADDLHWQTIQQTHDDTSSESTEWQCNLCQMIFSSCAVLQIHNQNQHGNDAIENGNDAPAERALNPEYSTVLCVDDVNGKRKNSLPEDEVHWENFKVPNLPREPFSRRASAAPIELEHSMASTVVIETREKLAKNPSSKVRDDQPKIGAIHTGLIAMRRYSISTRQSFSSSTAPSGISNESNNRMTDEQKPDEQQLLQQPNNVESMNAIPSVSNTTVIETETEMEEFVTIGDNGGATRKRKGFQSNNLAILGKKPTVRTIKPTDDVDVFGNFLILIMSKLADENYREQTEIELMNQLMKDIENQPDNDRGTPNGLAETRKRPMELRNPMNDVETFGHHFLMMLRQITNQKYREKTVQRLTSILIKRIHNKPVNADNGTKSIQL